MLTKLLSTNNIHELILDNIKFNKLKNPFDSRFNQFKYIQLPKIKKNKSNSLLYNNKNDNQGLDSDFQSIFRIHSSKFHLNKSESTGNLLNRNYIKEKILSNFSPTSKKINFNESNFRKIIAFHYRYMKLNNIENKNINSERKLLFKEKDKKLKKILKYSKLIPKNLLQRIEKRNDKSEDEILIINNTEDKKQNQSSDDEVEKKSNKIKIKPEDNKKRYKIQIIRNNKPEYIELSKLLL